MDNFDGQKVTVQGIDTEEDIPVDGEQQQEAADPLDNLPKVTATNLGDGGVDMQALDPDSLDPEMDYRWVHNSPAKITKRLRRGWTFVRKSSDLVQKLYDAGDEPGADDFIRDGDTVLMKIQKDRHKLQKDRVKMVTRARLAAPKGQFRKKAKDAGYNVAGRKYRGEPSQ